MRSNAAPAPRAGATNGLNAYRLELKYLVDRTTRTPLVRDLAILMGADGHSGADGSYAVRSLYFDTPDYMLYQEKIDGVSAFRRKLRTRVYGNDPRSAATVRLEVKSRYATHGHKSSVLLTRDEYRDVEAAFGRRTLPPAEIVDRDAGSREFFRVQRLYNMEPKILVQYRRQAFERREVGRVRVNIDDCLLASRDLELLGPMRGARRILEPGSAIFEIKVESFLPSWLHTLIGKYDLWNEAISKYCHAVRSLSRLSAVGRAGDDD